MHCSKLTHDDEFWLNDGTIVLVCQTIGFRVYRELLAHQSPVFANMLESSTPSSEESYQGLPVVQLSDSPTDLRHFLGALLPKRHILCAECSYLSRMLIDKLFIAATIRLAHKYDVSSLLLQALEPLKEYYAVTFDEWCNPHARYALSVDTRSCAIAAVNLARLTDTPSVLPLALYDCCLLGSAILDGWQNEDGVTEHLNTADLRLCLDARERLAQKNVLAFFSVYAVAVEVECRNRSGCEKTLRGMVQAGQAGVGKCEILVDLLLPHPPMCDACERALAGRARLERRRLWERLPEILGVEVDRWDAIVS
ncbi:uncharacterized protein BXZ73DRAFT_53770 [Epithele typhae]|uniref:uncharacterized protein n=1 Tax=Epithele typhae TaxID=378194 RepID=UPI002007CC7F|nr:uncharacterized protein BXZ73DRAFT_53770 [Epithele typhae]KAH9916592.1 hypothetical protein BXZ73DRAFT_53770 [Epithele typhae]